MRASTSTAAVLVLVALAAGCTDAGGRYAATFDGEPAVATADVARLVRSADAAGMFDGPTDSQNLETRRDYQRRVLSLLVRQAQLEGALADEGIEITDAEVQDAIDAQIAGVGGQEAFEQAVEETGLTLDLVPVIVRDDLLAQALNNDLDDAVREEVVASLNEIPVELDPRLGTYDQSRRLVVADTAA